MEGNFVTLEQEREINGRAYLESLKGQLMSALDAICRLQAENAVLQAKIAELKKSDVNG